MNNSPALAVDSAARLQEGETGKQKREHRKTGHFNFAGKRTFEFSFDII
ncbi:MAG TPA: hypothetical protein VJ654_19410 [Noviherbaspirillum sp.]|nr:hypothetical protein [Noviherbaspirillum sp.]